MNINDQLFLPIDSNYNGYQPIHIDLPKGYIIACKFVCCSDNSFEITHAKYYLLGENRTSEPKIYGIKEIPPVKFDSEKKINSIDLTNISLKSYINEDSLKIKQSSKSSFKKKISSTPIWEHIIDIHTTIDKPLFGNHICKIYFI